MTSKKILPLRPYPSIDLEFCFYLVLLARGVRVSDLAGICFKEEGLPADDTDVEVIDVDAIDRYKGQFTSATLMQATQYGKAALPGFKALCDLLANNNGTAANQQLGGYLKRLPSGFGPFAAVLRMIQHIEMVDDRGERLGSDKSLVYWIERFQKVCQTWFDYCRATLSHPDEAPVISYQDADRFGGAMPDLADKLDLDAFMDESSRPGRPAKKAFRAKPEALLTLTGYAIARYKLMSAEDWDNGGADKLRRDVHDWLNAFKAADRLERFAKEISERIAADLKKARGVPDEMVAQTEFGNATYIQGPGSVKIFKTSLGWGACFQTDLREAIPELWRLTKDEGFDLLVSRLLRPDGNVGIVTRAKARVDTSGLADLLNQVEGDLWAHEQRLHQGEAWSVLNGSKKIPKSPTSLTDIELIALCQRSDSLKLRPEVSRPQPPQRVDRGAGKWTRGNRSHGSRGRR